MNERMVGAWKEGSTAAVLRPYPNGTVGGVSDICHAENDFLNNHGFNSVEVVPRTAWHRKGWSNSKSMSLGIAVRAKHERLRTDAWWALSDPAEIRKLLSISTRQFLDIHEPAMYMPAYLLAVLRKLQWMNPHLVTIGTLHANASEKHLLKFNLAAEAQNTFNLVDAIIVNSYEMKTKYEKVFKEEFEVVENPVDTNLFTPRGPKLEGFGNTDFLDGKTNILYIGRLEKRKGLETALRAIASMSHNPDFQKTLDFRFIVAGSGPDEVKLHQIVDELGIGKYVVFMGRVSEKDKPKLYRSASFCYFPSETEESFGNVLLEAWASGNPVLAGMAYSDLLVRDGQNGFRLQSTDPAEAAYQLAKMTRNPQWMRSLGLQAFEFARQFDSKVIFAKRLTIAHRVHEEKIGRYMKQRTTSYPI